MPVDNDYKEVYFERFCPTCKHRDVKGYEEPCNECLENPVNLYSIKPIMWEEKEK